MVKYSSPCFSLNMVNCSYGSKTVLQDITLKLDSGIFYGLVGPNGSGKTTLLNHLLGNRPPLSGIILYQQKNVADYPRRELAKEIALVPQDFMINFDFSVYEIVLMGRHPYIPRFANPNQIDLQIVEQAMIEIGVMNFKNRPVTALSGGEKQRVVVARALAQDTPVLMLDEATSNLDISHTIKIFSAIKRRVAQHGNTVVAAIHDLNLAAAYCDRIILLDKGQVAAYGPTDQVLTAQNIKNIFHVESQTGIDELCGSFRISFNYNNSGH